MMDPTQIRIKQYDAYIHEIPLTILKGITNFTITQPIGVCFEPRTRTFSTLELKTSCRNPIHKHHRYLIKLRLLLYKRSAQQRQRNMASKWRLTLNTESNLIYTHGSKQCLRPII